MTRTLILLLVSSAVGCSGGASDQPDIAPVKGVVKLDGQPLAKATVVFKPDVGRPSTGETNENGEYELQYNRDTNGAKIGKCTVSITTYGEVDNDDGDPTVIPEKVPDVYNTKSTLSEVVKEGSNEFNFELDSKQGKVVQP